MKTKLFTTAFLLLALAWLCAEDSMYGAFRIKTKPNGADVTLYDPDIYLCDTPSPVYPVMMDEYMDLREGIPGRAIMLMITKKGYVPLKKEIFVPFSSEDMQEAMDNPSEFTFELEKDYHNLHWRICLFYSFRHRHPHPHFCFDRPHWQPWTPHGHQGGHGHGHNGHNPPPPPPPPPGGGHHPGGNGSGPADPPSPSYGFSTTPVPIPGRSPSKPNPPVIDQPCLKEKPAPSKLVPKAEKQDKPEKTQVIKSEKPEKKISKPAKVEENNKTENSTQVDKKEEEPKKKAKK